MFPYLSVSLLLTCFPFFFFQNSSPSSLWINSLDAPVVMPMTSSFPWGNPLPYPLTPLVDMPVGMSFNLYNNLWNTNYIYYYPYLDGVGDESSLFRFVMAWNSTSV